MPGTFHPPAEAAHRCSGMNHPRGYPAGTQFHCDECPQKWVVVEGTQYNDPYKAWRKLTPKNEDGRDRF